MGKKEEVEKEIWGEAKGNRVTEENGKVNQRERGEAAGAQIRRGDSRGRRCKGKQVRVGKKVHKEKDKVQRETITRKGRKGWTG